MRCRLLLVQDAAGFALRVVEIAGETVPFGQIVAGAIREVHEVYSSFQENQEKAESLQDSIRECETIINEMLSHLQSKDDEFFKGIAGGCLEIIEKIRALCGKWKRPGFFMTLRKALAAKRFEEDFQALEKALNESHSNTAMGGFLVLMEQHAGTRYENVQDELKALKLTSDKIVSDLDTTLTSLEGTLEKFTRWGAFIAIVSLCFVLVAIALSTYHHDKKFEDFLGYIRLKRVAVPDSKLPEAPKMFGRTQEYDRLFHELEQGGRAVSLLGGEGVGKSHIAKNFARNWLHQNKGKRFSCWIHADDEFSLRQSYANALELLSPRKNGRKNGRRKWAPFTLKKLASRFWNELGSSSFEWLGVFDNVPKIINGVEGPLGFENWFFPSHLSHWSHGRILFTTRSEEYTGKVLGINVMPITISKLKEAAAINMLMDHAVRDESGKEDAARELNANYFLGHPLAIVTATSEMSEQGISLGKYLSDLKLEKEHYDKRTVLRKSLKRLRAIGLSETLDVLAFMDPGRIQLELVGGDPERLGQLRSFGWLREEESGVYSIHQLHQDAARAGRLPTAALASVSRAIQSFDYRDMDNWEHVISIWPHLKSVLKEALSDRSDFQQKLGVSRRQVITILEFTCSALFLDVHGLVSVRTSCDEELALVRATHSPSALYAASLEALGNLCLGERDFECSRAHYHAALKEYPIDCGSDGMSYAKPGLTNKLGVVCYLEKNFECARDLFQEASTLYQGRWLNEVQNRYVATSLNNLAKTCILLGDYNDAISISLRALDMFRSVPDADDLEVCNVDDDWNLSTSVGGCDQARYDAWLFVSYLGYRIESDIAWTYSSLAAACDGIGDFFCARSYFDDAVALYSSPKFRRSDTYSEDFVIALMLISAAELRAEAGNFLCTRNYFNAGLPAIQPFIDQKMMDSDDIALALSTIGRTYQKTGRYVNARKHYDDALQNAVISNELSNSVAVYTNRIGEVEHSVGSYPEAKAKFEEALAIFQKLAAERNEHNPFIAETMINIAIAVHDLGDPKDAIVKLAEAYHLYQQLPKSDRNKVNTALALGYMGSAKVDVYDLTGAEENLADALQILKSVFGEEARHHEIARAIYHLRATLRQTGKGKQCSSCIRRSTTNAE